MIGNIMNEKSLKELLGNDGIIHEGYNEQISIDKLVPCGFNTFAIEDIETLVREIKIAGLITPLTAIGPYPDGTYRILSGERRYHALRRIHEEDHSMYDTVNCFICGNISMDETAQKLIMELANVSVRKVDEIPHRFEIVKLLRKLSDEGYMNKWNIGTSLAEYLGVAPNYARCYKRVVYADHPELEKMVEEKLIDIKLAAVLTKFEKKELEIFLNRVKQGENAWKIYRSEYMKKKSSQNIKDEQYEESNSTVEESTVSSPTKEDFQQTYTEQMPVDENAKDERVKISSDESSSAIPQDDNVKEKDSVPLQKEERKTIPTFDSSAFTTEKLKDIFNDYTGSNFEDVIHTETKTASSNERSIESAVFDHNRMKKGLRFLLEKEDITLADEEVIELCKEIADKYDLY